MLDIQFQKNRDSDLSDAIIRQDSDMVNAILQAECVTQECKDHKLWYAATMGETEIAEAIEAAGGNPQERLNGELNFAASQGDIAEIDRLLEAGARIDNHTHFPIKTAVFENHLEAAKHLHDKGSVLNMAFDYFELHELRENKQLEYRPMMSWVSQMLEKEKNPAIELNSDA